MIWKLESCRIVCYSDVGVKTGSDCTCTEAVTRKNRAHLKRIYLKYRETNRKVTLYFSTQDKRKTALFTLL